jgi:ATP-binding cassette subfamily B protein IrtA
MAADALPISYPAVLRMLRPVHVNLIACAALAAIAAAAGLLPYIAIGAIARQVLSGTTDAVWLWLAIGALGAFARLVCLGLDSHIGHHADAKMLHHLRERIVDHLGAVPLGWFRTAGSGQVKKAMTVDLEAMHVLFAHSLGEVVGAGTAVIVAVGYLVSIDRWMTAITVAVPLAAFLTYRLAMRSMPEHTGASSQPRPASAPRPSNMRTGLQWPRPSARQRHWTATAKRFANTATRSAPGCTKSATALRPVTCWLPS